MLTGLERSRFETDRQRLKRRRGLGGRGGRPTVSRRPEREHREQRSGQGARPGVRKSGLPSRSTTGAFSAMGGARPDRIRRERNRSMMPVRTRPSIASVSRNCATTVCMAPSGCSLVARRPSPSTVRTSAIARIPCRDDERRRHGLIASGPSRQIQLLDLSRRFSIACTREVDVAPGDDDPRDAGRARRNSSHDTATC